MKVIGVKIKVKVNDKTEMKLQASLIAISVIFLKAINQNAMFVPKWACMGGGGGGVRSTVKHAGGPETEPDNYSK